MKHSLSGSSLLLLLLLTGCTPHHQLLKNAEATIIYGFEQVDVGSGEKDYFFKSASCVTDEGVYDLNKGKFTKSPQWHDLLGRPSTNSPIYIEVTERLSKKYRIDCEENAPEATAFFSKKIGLPGIHYSDWIYNYNLDDSQIYIIFNVTGNIALIKKASAEALAMYNKRYTCPVKLDSLAVPFFKVVKLNAVKPTPEAFLKRNDFYKMAIDSFRINFCD